MKFKYIILSTLAAFVLAGCESEKSQKQEEAKLEAQRQGKEHEEEDTKE